MGLGHRHALHVHGHSPVHRLAPEVKVAATVLFVAAVAVTPREAWWAFALDATVLAIIGTIARVPFGFVAARLLVVTPFVLFAALLPFVGAGEQVDVLGISLSREGLAAAWNILAKAILGSTTAILLAATTELTDVLTGLERLRVPRTLTAIAGFMIRYLDVIADEFRRARTAMTARGYDPRWVWQAKPLAASSGALFIRTYERGERVHAAMLARGFDGEMPRLSERRAPTRAWVAGLAVVLPAWAAAAAGLVVT